MTTATELLAMTLPGADGDWRQWLAVRCSTRLEEARASVRALTAAQPGTLGPLEALHLWNDVNIALSDAAGASTLLIQVHPVEGIRSLAETAAQEAKKLATEVSLDRSVYEVLAAVEADQLDPAGRRVLLLAQRDFARAGVDSDEETRQRLRELSEQETLLGQRFAKNIRDDVRSVFVEHDRMRGLPADYVEAHPPMQTAGTGSPPTTQTYCPSSPSPTTARRAMRCTSRSSPAVGPTTTPSCVNCSPCARSMPPSSGSTTGPATTHR